MQQAAEGAASHPLIAWAYTRPHLGSRRRNDAAVRQTVFMTRRLVRRNLMTLLAYYVALLLADNLIAVMLCFWIARFSPAAIIYFANVWPTWILAVRLSEAKIAESVAT